MLASQDYLPLLDAQRQQTNNAPLPMTDRRVVRGRTTRLSILEVLQMLQDRLATEPAREFEHTLRSSDRHVTGRLIVAMLHPHPTTVYEHLEQLRAQGIIM